MTWPQVVVAIVMLFEAIVGIYRLSRPSTSTVGITTAAITLHLVLLVGFCVVLHSGDFW